MGVNMQRLTLAALALAALLLPIRKRSAMRAIESVPSHAARLDTLLFEQWRVRDRWVAFQERDSALTLFKSGRAAAGAPVIKLEGVSTFGRTPEDATGTASLWKKIATPDTTVSVGFLVYHPNGYRGWNYAGAWVTSDQGHTTCVGIASGQISAGSRTIVSRRSLDYGLAPCVLLATFGAPGAGMQAWLTSTRFVSARSNSWAIGPEPYESRRGPWASWMTSTHGDDDISQLHALFAKIGLEEVATLSTPPYYFGAVGLHCINGDETACVEGVLHPDLMSRGEQGIPADLTPPDHLYQPAVTTLGTVRPAAPSLLSALITQFGRQRFTTFWKSDLPFETAFQQAFGVSLGAWTATWARREWLRTVEAEVRGGATALGVTLEPVWALVAIGWTAVVLVVASMVARRRQAI